MSTTLASPKPEIEIQHTQCFIDGRWEPAASGKTFATYNPATEEEIAQVAEGDAADVDRAARAARKAFDSGPWSRMDARDRGRLLYKLADAIESQADELAALETLDNGKPINESRKGDLPLVIDCLRYYAGFADKIQGSTIPIRGNYLCYTRREPVGVAGQIIPWNFPMLMTAWKWGPALAAGCTVVMKPAEQTPLTCLRLAAIAQEVGFPDGVINVVPGFGPTAGAAVVRHPMIDKIAFTGEHTTAQIITRDSAATLKRLTFELGGKSPNVVMADADLDAAAQGAYIGLYLNQGQCCCAGSRLFVEASIRDRFLEKLTKLAANRKVGDPFDTRTEQGPQIDRSQFDKIMSYIDKGQSEGAKLLTGGKRVGDRGFFIEPTIFDGVDDEMSIAREEIFGPVMSIIAYDDIEHAIEIANDTPYGLSAYVQSADAEAARRVARRLRAGQVHVNNPPPDRSAPFGGYKQSGNGRENGVHGISEFLETKALIGYGA